MFPGRALGLVPAGGQRERVAVRLLPVALPAGLTLLDLKEVLKSRLQGKSMPGAQWESCGFDEEDFSKISVESMYLHR